MNFTNKPSVRWLNKISYSIALELQHQLVEKTIDNPDMVTILGMEHPSVITLGKRAIPEEEIKINVDSLEDLNIQYYKVDRGGHATLHSPGQLVIYPILKLSEHNLSVRDYLCTLQKATIKFFKHYGIETYAKDDSPGIYSETGKIAFFGIRVQKGVSFHGLSINVSNETEDFSLIRSCGTNQERFDKMANHKINDSLENIFQTWVDFWNKERAL